MIQKQNNPGHSPLMLKIRPKIKTFKPDFLNAVNFFSKIGTERTLVWYIARPIPMIIYDTWFCVENKKG